MRWVYLGTFFPVCLLQAFIVVQFFFTEIV